RASTREGRSLVLPPLRDREVVGEDEEAAADDHDEAADGEVVECHSVLQTARTARVRAIASVTVTGGQSPVAVPATKAAALTLTAAGQRRDTRITPLPSPGATRLPR